MIPVRKALRLCQVWLQMPFTGANSIKKKKKALLNLGPFRGCTDELLRSCVHQAKSSTACQRARRAWHGCSEWDAATWGAAIGQAFSFLLASVCSWKKKSPVYCCFIITNWVIAKTNQQSRGVEDWWMCLASFCFGLLCKHNTRWHTSYYELWRRKDTLGINFTLGLTHWLSERCNTRCW